MKAAVFQEAHKPLTIEDVDIIDPRAGEVLVRTSCRVYVTPICILWMGLAVADELCPRARGGWCG